MVPELDDDVAPAERLDQPGQLASRRCRATVDQRLGDRARIVAVADVFDALTSKRPYKDAWPVEKALKVMNEEAGLHFDPEVVAALNRSLPRILEIYELRKHI